MTRRASDAMHDLRTRLAGTLVTRTDADYAAVRRSLVWNQLQPSYGPEAIVRVANEADVVEAVRFAAVRGLRVAVRGSGHDWSGTPLREGGLLLDLARLGQVEIDAAARLARVQPVVSGRDFLRRLAPHGLAFPTGHCPSVALSGYLLGGGLGWNPGTWGAACLSVRAVDVVTADGRLLTASEDQHAELLWAARGAGSGFFGVVTRYQLALHALPRAITTSTFVHPVARAPELMEAAAEAARSMPPSVELVAILASAPPRLADACGKGGRACIVSATAFVDTETEARAALAPLAHGVVGRDCLLRDEHRPTPFDDLFATTARSFPERHRYLADSVWTNAAPAAVVTPLAEGLVAAPSPKSLALCTVLTGDPPALRDVAFGRTGRLLVLSYAVWEEARHDAANRAWFDELTATLDPCAVGHYVGESRPGRAPRSFADASWQRLAALRRTWDPDTRFHDWPTA